MDKLKIVEYLSKKVDDTNIYIDEEMKKHTTFKIGGKADILVKVKSEIDLEYILKFAKQNNIQITILGNGSNVLVEDKGIRGIVLKIELNNIQFLENNEVLIESGVKLGFLAQKLLKENLSGFEAAAGIPGTIGGGLRMNAGAYGWEFKDCVIKTKCLDLDKFYKSLDFQNSIVWLDNKSQEFGYRTSIFKNNKYIILATVLEFSKSSYEEINKKMQEFANSRKEKQPVGEYSAGSTFKRGSNFITAQIIDECGLKGLRIGNAEVSTKHAGFIVNKNNANAKDVIHLIKAVEKQVMEKKGLEIEMEIEIIGESE